MLGGIGGFAGLFALKLGRYTEPVLAASTDGVGTKVAIAQALDKHDTIGLDLVAMVVDDLVVCGAEPLFLQDYIAVGKLVPEHVAAVVAGHRRGLPAGGLRAAGRRDRRAPRDDGGGRVRPVGHRRRDRRGRRHAAARDHVRPGDVLVGMGSSGLHSNGYSLARHVLLRIARMPLEGHVEELGHTLGEELLVPTTIYARDCLALVAETNIHTFAHITGGGLARNLARVLPDGLGAVVERGSWTPQPVFRLIAAARPGGARGDGADVQHGRRDGRGAARRRRRPRAGRAHRPARARVGARRGAPRLGRRAARASTRASDHALVPRRPMGRARHTAAAAASARVTASRPARAARPVIRHASVRASSRGSGGNAPIWVSMPRSSRTAACPTISSPRSRWRWICRTANARPVGGSTWASLPSSKTVNGPVCLPLKVICERTWCSSATEMCSTNRRSLNAARIQAPVASRPAGPGMPARGRLALGLVVRPVGARSSRRPVPRRR